MYVILDVSWLRHSFPKSQFKLRSAKQIERIVASEIREVKVDTSKSDTNEEQEASASPPGAKDDQARPSGEGKTLSQDSGGDAGSMSVVAAGEEQGQPGPDTLTVDDGPEGSGIDTVTIKDQDEEIGSGIDTVTIKDRDEEIGSGIDTVTIEDQYDELGSGIDRVTLSDQGELEGTLPTQMVRIENLAVGMYVTLNEKPDSISFLEDSFRIATEDQLEELVNSGIVEVRVDVGMSDPDAIPRPEAIPIDNIVAELRATLQQPLISPRAKARAIYQHSLQMMEHLLAQPSAKNITHGKEMVRDIVDQIMSDDETANFMVLTTAHDYHTYTHSVNVGVLSILLAKAALNDSTDYNLGELGAGFFLHDLGEIRIPANIFSKPGKLSAADWDLIRMHPALGDKILAATNVWSQECSRIILQHHEREDGTGYPQGLSGGSIDLSAQICRIADVYDALTSRRPYKAGPQLHPFQALQTMKDSLVNQFNADLFRVFVSLFSK